MLEEAGFDSFVEELCEPHYKRGWRPGIPPGGYFRMLFNGYFEGLGSQRGVAWRCADSLALRSFLGYQRTEPTPVHASMTVIRQRLPESVFTQVFERVLGQLHEAGRVRGKCGKQLNRWRSERVERTFAHVCETGGGRRTWLRGLTNTFKAHLLRCVAHNLGLLMRKAHGMGKPRSAGVAGMVVLAGVGTHLVLSGHPMLLTAALIGLCYVWIKSSVQKTQWQLLPIHNFSSLKN